VELFVTTAVRPSNPTIFPDILMLLCSSCGYMLGCYC
jgi:hypothetical protein